MRLPGGLKLENRASHPEHEQLNNRVRTSRLPWCPTLEIQDFIG